MNDDLRARLAAHDPIWHAPALTWDEAALCGNGLTGAAVWGTGRPLIVNVDAADSWEHRVANEPDPATHGLDAFRAAMSGDDEAWGADIPLHDMKLGDSSATTRTPPSRIEIDLGAEVTEMRLDLASATVGVIAGDRSVRVWVARHADVVVIDGALEHEPSAVFFRDVPFRGLAPGLADVFGPDIDPSTLVLTPQRFFEERGWKDAITTTEGDVTVISQLGSDGGSFALASKAVGDSLFVAPASSPTPAAAELATDRIAVATTEADLRRRHEEWWADHQARSSLQLSDTRTESLWWIEMYKLACCARPGGPAISLIGPWAPDGMLPVWGGDFHHNINQQMPYWPMFPANRVDLAESLADWLDRARPEFADFCERFIGRPGEWVVTSTDDDGRCRFDWPMVWFDQTNGAWLAQTLWPRWTHHRDRDYLASRLLPFMVECARAVLPDLVEAEDGRLHVQWSFSPEYPVKPHHYGTDATHAVTLVSWLCGAIVEAVDELGATECEHIVGADLLGRIADAAERLTSPPSTEGGIGLASIMGDRFGGLDVRDDVRFDRSHRHHAHLMGIYPLEQISIRDPDDRELIEASILHWIYRGRGEWVGFSWPWAASILARCGRPELAVSTIREYRDHWITPSTLMVQYPPAKSLPTVWNEADRVLDSAVTLESGGGYANAVIDLLFQSDTREIRLFPAWPACEGAAAFDGFVGNGGLHVDAATDGVSGWYAITNRGDRAVRRSVVLPVAWGVGDHVVDLSVGERVEWGRPLPPPAIDPGQANAVGGLPRS